MTNTRADGVNVKTLEDLSKTVDLLNKSLKAVSFRNIAVIAILAIIGLPTYVSFWLLKLENRPVLLNLLDGSKVVQVVGDCPTVRTVGLEGDVVYTTYLTYRVKPNTFIIATVRPGIGDDDTEHTICQQLTTDRDKLLRTVP